MVSNKLLSIFIIITIVISLGGLFLSLNSMDSLSTVAYATSTNASASVSLILPGYLIIDVLNDSINFGSCSIDRDKGYSIFDSGESDSAYDNSRCVNASFPSYLTVVNIGDIDANVTFEVDIAGDELFSNSSSWFAYHSLNATIKGGCITGLQEIYTNISLSNFEYPVCSNLTNTNISNAVSLAIRAKIGLNATGNASMNFQFLATPAS